MLRDDGVGQGLAKAVGVGWFGPGPYLQVTGITTVEPQRTFWDKIVILHGLRAWHGRRGQLRHGGQRVSRHYFEMITGAVPSFADVMNAIGALERRINATR
jgi:hypothetical protein